MDRPDVLDVSRQIQSETKMGSLWSTKVDRFGSLAHIWVTVLTRMEIDFLNVHTGKLMTQRNLTSWPRILRAAGARARRASSITARERATISSCRPPSFLGVHGVVGHLYVCGGKRPDWTRAAGRVGPFPVTRSSFEGGPRQK